MKIHHIIGQPPIIISNEERNFVNKHGDTVSLGFLDEHQSYLANNLVRKGVYTISTDKRYIIRKDKSDEQSSF
jgi:hypothetical protein